MWAGYRCAGRDWQTVCTACSVATLTLHSVAPTAGFSVGYSSLGGQQRVAALDLICSDGTTVPDAAVNATARAALAFSTTPAVTASIGIAAVSAVFQDTFANFRAGSEVISGDAVLTCPGSHVSMGAKIERWAPGQGGSLGTAYAGAAK